MDTALPGMVTSMASEASLASSAAAWMSAFRFFQLLLDACPDGIRQLTHDGALLSGQLAHLLQHRGQLALLAQQPDAKLFQSRRGGGSFQRCQGIGFDLL